MFDRSEKKNVFAIDLSNDIEIYLNNLRKYFYIMVERYSKIKIKIVRRIIGQHHAHKAGISCVRVCKFGRGYLLCVCDVNKWVTMYRPFNQHALVN